MRRARSSAYSIIEVTTASVTGSAQLRLLPRRNSPASCLLSLAFDNENGQGSNRKLMPGDGAHGAVDKTSRGGEHRIDRNRLRHTRIPDHFRWISRRERQHTG